jgi:DNA polymerase elongation subunit (family B)
MATLISNPSFVGFKSNDTGAKAIIDKIKFFNTEAEILKKFVQVNSLTNNDIIFIFVKWMQVWKYLKDNLQKFKNNDIISCGLKETLMMNIYEAMVDDSISLFIPLLKIWLDENISSICTGREVIQPS